MAIFRIGGRVLNEADLNIKIISDIRKRLFKAAKKILHSKYTNDFSLYIGSVLFSFHPIASTHPI